MGKKTRIQYLSKFRENKFPNLARAGYRVTSSETPLYNCIAFAAGDSTQWWDLPPYHWPGAIVSEYIEGLESVFASLGYFRCQGGDLEPGYQKVALYVDSAGKWQHAARQSEDGEWESKLGPWEDIRHRTPNAFGGSEYGNVMYYMKRALPASKQKRRAIKY